MEKALFKKARFVCTRTVVLMMIIILVFTDIQSILNFKFLPSVDEVEAATGDFSIFRESTGTETVNSNGTPLDLTWDTTVSANGNIPLLGSASEIDLTEGGKYLVTYNAKFEEGTTTSSNRRSVESWLSLDGSEIPYGRASGYLRDTDGLLEAYLSGGAIIDATAGQNLKLSLARNDVNTTAGTNLAPNTNAINVLKLKDGWDYLRVYQSATTSDVNLNTTFTEIQWNTSDEVDTGSFGFTATSSNITLSGDADAKYLVTANVTLFVDGTANTRQNYEMQLTLDGTEISGTRVTAYPRGNQSGEIIQYATLSYMGIISKPLTANQILSLEMRRETTSSQTTDIVRNETAMTIVALPDTGEYIRLLDDTGTQTLSNTAQDMTWNTQQELDTGAFGHSTTTGSDVINIDKAGDYMFFATAYETTVNGNNNRQPFTMNWKESSSQVNRGSFGSYNRNNNNNSGGSSGSVLLNGLTTASFVELEYLDESANAPVTSTFNANRVAIQGILLDDNFFGTDVFVTATGTHEIETSITTTDFYSGGAFVLTEQSSSRNITDITITESGTVDAQNGLDNIELYYDLDTSAPYDCASESFTGTSTETQFGITDINGFSGTNGVSGFSGSVTISTTDTMCVYVVYDVTTSSTDSQTVQITIDDPSNDVTASGGATIGPATLAGPTASTTLRNAELTQTHYRWLNDDGTEGSATAVEAEDIPAIGFSNGTIRRLRSQIDAAGSTTSIPTTFQLDYATKTAACNTLTSWDDVGATGGAWDMSNSSFITDGVNATNIGIGSGGVSDPAGASFLGTNGGLRDINSTTNTLTLTSSQFVEFEFAIEPTATAPQGNTYCFRYSDAGTELRNYDVYPEGTISADIDVSASSSQVLSLDQGSTGQYVGGTFVIERPGSNRTVTSVTITETGTVDGLTNLDNIELWYDLDTTTPFDCTGESYSGFGETQFGTTDTTGFSSANGSSTFTGSETVGSSRSMCMYAVLDVGSGAANGETINIEISDPSSDVVVTSSSVGPSTSISPNGSTTVAGQLRTLTHYHWRNDDGDETDGIGGATSASGGTEDTAISTVPKTSTRRLRMQVSNEGSVTTSASQYRLEYGTKITTCSAVSAWTDVGATSGAFDMVNTANLTDGNNTTDIVTSSGGVTNANLTFLSPNSGQKDISSQTGNITLTSTEFVELEYAIEATVDAGDDTTYCFRLSDSGTSLEAYDTYAEFTTREKRDFFIQRGTLFVSGTSTTLVAGTDYTAPSASTSAFIRITNTQITGAGRSTGGQPQNTDDVTAYFENPENIETSVTIARPSTAINDTRVSWEIIEYIGLAGADNEMIVRDNRTITYGSTALNATGTTVSNVTDNTDVVVFITGQLNPNTGNLNYNDGISTSEWIASTSQPVFTRGDATSIATQLSYAIVEFTGVNWNIQRVENNYTGITTETQSITAVGSPSRVFIYAQKRAEGGENGLHDIGQTVWLSSIGAVSFALQDTPNPVTSPALHSGVAWVIENTQTGVGALDVNRSDGVLIRTTPCGGAQPCTQSVTIAAITPSNASIWITSRSTGAGQAFPRAMVGAEIASSTQYNLWRSETGQDQTFRTEIIEWPTAQLAFRQNYYRFYVDNDALLPTDPWPVGVSNLGENESITALNDPVAESEIVRIRMTLAISNATFPESTKSFKLQYGLRDTTCSAISSWNDVGAIGSGSIWRGYNGTPTDGDTISSTTLAISLADIAASYEEQNNSAINPFGANIGEDVEFDWVVEHNGASQRSDYCFRMLESDDTLLAGYNNYPTLRTTGYTPVTANWRWYDDATSTTPTNPFANENIAPVDIANNNEIKLRLTVAEIENAAGNNAKFKLQYSEYSDFSRSVFDVSASTTCSETSIWCYADGGGADGTLIDSAVLSDTDSCTGGVGIGCGLYTEGTTTVSTLTQTAGSNMEFEFVIQHAGARVNSVYYFRAYDLANDDAVLASSSYPSLVTEGASLTFSIAGVASSTATEGIVTNVGTTPSGITFGDLPNDSEIEAAHRLTVDTNATEGYQVFAFGTSELTSTVGATIAAISGTNGSPTSWAAGCASSPNGCFGYHTGDDTLSGGSTRFSANDTYAALESTPREFISSSVPVIGEITDVVYKTQIQNLQAAGQYETGVVYIAIPVF